MWKKQQYLPATNIWSLQDEWIQSQDIYDPINGIILK